MKSILILCLLGDPMLPAGSCDRTGGFNVDMSELIEFFSEKPYRFLIVTNQSEEAPAAYEKINRNMCLYRVSLNGANQNEQKELVRQASFIERQILEILEETQFRPAFIHSHYWLSGYIAHSIAQRFQIPFIHSVVALSKDKEISNAQSDYQVQMGCEYQFFPCAKVIFSITDTEKETLCTKYHLPEQRVLVIGREVPAVYQKPVHNELGIARGLDTAAALKCFHNKQDSADWWNAGAFTYVGRLKREKGIYSVIDAWLQLHRRYGRRTPPLWIVGGDVEAMERLRPQLYSQFPQLPEQEQALRICWWGHLDPQAISALYLKTLALVTHSQYEAGGRVIIEAMSQGIPVIATPVGFAKDLIRDWYNGFIVPYNDIEQLSRRMSAFMAQPLLSNTLGLAARDTILSARNRWDCYRRVDWVYQCLFDKQPASQGPDIPTGEMSGTDYFSLGLISSYPYAYDRSFVAEDGLYARRTLPETGRFSETLHAWIFETNSGGTPALSICYYSELNKARLWNRQVEEAFTARERMRRAALSCKSAAALPVLMEQPELCQLTVPDSPFLTLPELRESGMEVLELLRRFNLSPIGDAMPSPVWYGADVSTWADMYRELAGLLQPFLSQAGIPRLLDRLFIDGEEKKPGPIVCNYGAGLEGRIGRTAQGSLALMPSAEMFRGEIGYDAGRFLYDFFADELSGEEGQRLFNFTMDCFDLEKRGLLKWVLLAAMERLTAAAAMELPQQITACLAHIKGSLALLNNL